MRGLELRPDCITYAAFRAGSVNSVSSVIGQEERTTHTRNASSWIELCSREQRGQPVATFVSPKPQERPGLTRHPSWRLPRSSGEQGKHGFRLQERSLTCYAIKRFGRGFDDRAFAPAERLILQE
jgi:hypothetical protein